MQIVATKIPNVALVSGSAYLFKVVPPVK